MDQDKVLNESFKVWEQFATSYTNMMFDTMERTLKESEAFRTQLDDAVERGLKAWQLPVRSDQSQMLGTLNNLQAQIQALSEKVDKLEQAVAKLPKKE